MIFSWPPLTNVLPYTLYRCLNLIICILGMFILFPKDCLTLLSTSSSVGQMAVLNSSHPFSFLIGDDLDCEGIDL